MVGTVLPMQDLPVVTLKPVVRLSQPGIAVSVFPRLVSGVVDLVKLPLEEMEETEAVAVTEKVMVVSEVLALLAVSEHRT